MAKGAGESMTTQSGRDDRSGKTGGNDPTTAPARVMVYERAARKLDLLYVGRPALAGVTLPKVCPVEIGSRDGLTLVSYLTLPVGKLIMGSVAQRILLARFA